MESEKTGLGAALKVVSALAADLSRTFLDCRGRACIIRSFQMLYFTWLAPFFPVSISSLPLFLQRLLDHDQGNIVHDEVLFRNRSRSARRFVSCCCCTHWAPVCQRSRGGPQRQGSDRTQELRGEAHRAIWSKEMHNRQCQGAPWLVSLSRLFSTASSSWHDS